MTKINDNEVAVYMVARSVRYIFATFDSMCEAEEFCESNNWIWMDENCFEWDLEIG
jgi:hypothetical protein